MRLKARSMYSCQDMPDIAAEDPGEVDHDRQEWHHDHEGDDAGDRQILERIDGIGLECVDLFGHLHRADLRADARTDDGDTFVLRAGPSFELLHVNRMGEGTLASPALVDGRWYIRTDRNLIAVGA